MKIRFLLFGFCLSFSTFAQTKYQLPPKEILALADIKSPPLVIVSKSNKYLLMLERPLYKNLDELAETEVKLAGLRINPENFNVSRNTYYNSIKIQSVAETKELPIIGLPMPLRAQNITFSPNEKYCSFIQVLGNRIALWVIDLKTGNARQLAEMLNATMGTTYVWNHDDAFIYCKWKGDKQKMTDSKELPVGPATQDATGTKAPARTYQDLLRNKQDEAKFDYYTTASYIKVYLDGHQDALLGNGIYKRFSLSPDGKYILTEEVQQPYSYTLTYGSFPSRFVIYDQTGKTLREFYNRPLQDKVPVNFDAVEAGKRNIMWRSDKPSTLLWCEAPDGGDPGKTSEYRDQLFQSDYPFEETRAICFLKNRLSDITFGKTDFAIVSDFWWKNRNTKTYIINPSLDKQEPKIIYDLSSEDVYANPGDFETRYNEYNREVLEFSKDGKKLFLVGEGYSPEGNKPFIDEFDIALGKTKRLWRADGKSTYEKIVRIIDIEKKTAITSIESPKIYPNLYIRNYGGSAKPVQLTFRENPYLPLMNVSKQKIFYKRNDGVQLSATLYLPAGYDKTKTAGCLCSWKHTLPNIKTTKQRDR